MIRKASVNDLILWPDGTVCLRGDLHEYAWKSDDYEVITEDNPDYERLLEEAGETP